MSAAIKNIPFHCFNDHSNCGDWCGYNEDPEKYKHSTIENGFADIKLFDACSTLFRAKQTDLQPEHQAMEMKV